MEFERLLTTAKWAILSELAKGERSASEIAKATGTSLPNISQQIKLLEAWGLVKLRKESKGVPGKPRLIYGLNKELAHVAMIKEGLVGKRVVALDQMTGAIMSIMLLPKQDDHYFLQKFFWLHEDYIDACDAIGVAESNPGEIHLLVFAKEKALAKLREEHSKIKVEKSKEEKKTVISWTHTAEEFIEGYANGDDYFKNLAKNLHIIKDPHKLFEAIR